MEEEQFFLVLPSNSSMSHFPDNTTSFFITELPHSIVLHGQWEVAKSEIQFLCSFLHVRHNENVIRFVDVKPDEENGAFTAKEVTFPNGIYNDIHEFIDAINTACKIAESHFYFEQQKASDGDKVLISINCDEKYKMLHHINFFDNFLRILDFASAIFSKYQFYSNLMIRKPNSNEEKICLTYGFKETGKRLADGYWSSEPYSLWRGIPDKMFVYCDICEPYITGDVRPLLRIVPVEIRVIITHHIWYQFNETFLISKLYSNATNEFHDRNRYKKSS